MIIRLLVKISRNQWGQIINRERVVSGESISLGRGADCSIRLPDHRVALHHATVRQSPDGALYIEAERNATLKVQGIDERKVLLTPGMGVEIGPYELLVDPASTFDKVMLSVEAKQTHVHTPVAVEPVTLADLNIDKRKWGLILAAVILVAYLLLPMLFSFVTPLVKWQSTLPVTVLGSWSPGPMAQGHSVFGANCASCHEHAFTPVADTACEQCHKQVGKHLTDESLHGSLFNSMRCTECHVEHKGGDVTTRKDTSTCVACHGDIKAKYPKSNVPNVHTFSKDHPPFRVTLSNDPNGRPLLRVLPGQPMVETPRLKYSHQVHLDKKGISSPQGDTVMVCQDCHKLDAGGNHFLPMTMKQTCQQSSCHGMDYAEPAEGEVPHGSEKEAMGRLREYYVKWLAETPSGMSDCENKDTTADPIKQILYCAGELARKNASVSLFGKNLGCSECHELEPSGNADSPWKVVPLQINHNWHANSVFPHAKHKMTECAACHDKANSTSSADVAMPKIEKCRECHVDNRPAKNKVFSSCVSCHRFHGGIDVAKP